MNVELKREHLTVLLIFDIIFAFDRLFDLFVGYHNPNGQLEHRLMHVLY